MIFAPLKLCQKLYEMGCKSEACQFYYRKNIEGADLIHLKSNLWSRAGDIPAFSMEDFTGSGKQDQANANIIWGDEKAEDCAYSWCVGCNEGCCGKPHSWHHRHAMIDAKNWIKYLTNHTRGKL